MSKTEKLTITNIYDSPYGVNAGGGLVMLGAGETRTLELSEAEAIGVRGNPKVFQVGGEKGLDTSKVHDAEAEKNYEGAIAVMTALAPLAYKLGVNTHEELAPAIEKLIAENDRLTAELATANLRGHDEPTKSAARASGTGGTGGTGAAAGASGASGTGNTAPSLADAIASLDDKNDAHWIQSGKPSLDYLKELTGGDVARADVDKINRERKSI